MNKNRIKKDLFAPLSEYPSVLSAYLFGSAATGIERKGSDVDIAVRLDENLSVSQIISLRFHLMDVFENYFNRSADIVILNSASLKLIHQVLKRGKLIYAREPDSENVFAIQKQKEYFDFKYYIDKDIDQMRTFFGC